MFGTTTVIIFKVNSKMNSQNLHLKIMYKIIYHTNLPHKKIQTVEKFKRQNEFSIYRPYSEKLSRAFFF